MNNFLTKNMVDNAVFNSQTGLYELSKEIVVPTIYIPNKDIIIETSSSKKENNTERMHKYEIFC